MKVWELYSACRTNREALERVAGIANWREWYELLRDAENLAEVGNRKKVDLELPDELCRTVLAGVTLTYRISEGYVRTARVGPAGEFSAVDIFDRYGGGFLEDVNEAGLKKIPGQ